MSRRDVIDALAVGAAFLAAFTLAIWAVRAWYVGYGNPAYNQFYQLMLGATIGALALVVVLNWANDRL